MESLETLEINTEVKEGEEGAGKCQGYESHAQTDICWVEVCSDKCSLTNNNPDVRMIQIIEQTENFENFMVLFYIL